MSEETIHRDHFGKELTLGDWVVYSRNDVMRIGVVKKLNLKTMAVGRSGKGTAYQVVRAGANIIKLDGADLTMYLLKSKKQR